MGRQRKRANKDLPTGLYFCPQRRLFFTRRQNKPLYLGRDKTKAAMLLLQLQAVWATQDADLTRYTFETKLAQAQDEKAVPFNRYCQRWRDEILPTLVNKKSQRPLSVKTRHDYAMMLKNQIEPYADFSAPLRSIDSRCLRQFLKTWLTSPGFYNYMTSLLSRIFQTAIDEGCLDDNPTLSIARQAVAKRDAYIKDEEYAAIIGRMQAQGVADFVIRACNLCYLLSHNPIDVLRLREEDIEIYDAPRIPAGAPPGVESWGTVAFSRKKTTQAMIIEMNRDLCDVVAWFREWKQAEGLANAPTLICYPRASGARHRGKPVSVAYLSRAFTAAANACALERRYTLRDVRPKGLTDEWIGYGENDKGGHKTEAMKRHYRRIALPLRARNNLRLIRAAGEE